MAMAELQLTEKLQILSIFFVDLRVTVSCDTKGRIFIIHSNQSAIAQGGHRWQSSTGDCRHSNILKFQR